MLSEGGRSEELNLKKCVRFSRAVFFPMQKLVPMRNSPRMYSNYTVNVILSFHPLVGRAFSSLFFGQKQVLFFSSSSRGNVFPFSPSPSPKQMKHLSFLLSAA